MMTNQEQMLRAGEGKPTSQNRHSQRHQPMNQSISIEEREVAEEEFDEPATGEAEKIAQLVSQLLAKNVRV